MENFEQEIGDGLQQEEVSAEHRSEQLLNELRLFFGRQPEMRLFDVGRLCAGVSVALVDSFLDGGRRFVARLEFLLLGSDLLLAQPERVRKEALEQQLGRDLVVLRKRVFA